MDSSNWLVGTQDVTYDNSHHRISTWMNFIISWLREWNSMDIMISYVFFVGKDMTFHIFFSRCSFIHMEVSWNRGYPHFIINFKMGFSLISHPAIGVPPWLWKPGNPAHIPIIHHHIPTINHYIPIDSLIPLSLSHISIHQGDFLSRCSFISIRLRFPLLTTIFPLIPL